MTFWLAPKILCREKSPQNFGSSGLPDFRSTLPSSSSQKLSFEPSNWKNKGKKRLEKMMRFLRVLCFLRVRACHEPKASILVPLFAETNSIPSLILCPNCALSKFARKKHGHIFSRKKYSKREDKILKGKVRISTSYHQVGVKGRLKQPFQHDNLKTKTVTTYT